MELGTLNIQTQQRLQRFSSGQSPRVARDLRELKEVTGKVVGSVFFGTLLKSMRDSTLKGKYGHGGRGEDVFSAQLHNLYAENVGSSMQNGIGATIYKRLEHQQALYSAQRKLS